MLGHVPQEEPLGIACARLFNRPDVLPATEPTVIKLWVKRLRMSVQQWVTNGLYATTLDC